MITKCKGNHPDGECGVRPCPCHPDKPEGLVEDLMTAISGAIHDNSIDLAHEEVMSKAIEAALREELAKRLGHPIEEIERIVKPLLHEGINDPAMADLWWLKIENALISSTLWPVMPYPNDELLAKLRNAGWMVGSHNDYRQDGKRFTFWLMTHPSGIYLVGEGRTDAEALAEIEKQARKVFAPSP